MSEIVRERAAELSDFSGGLNNYWDPASIAENEVPYLLNMEFSSNGGLVSRPPIVDAGAMSPSDTGYFKILGFFYVEDYYVIATQDGSTWAADVVVEEGAITIGTWTEIWDNEASDFIQYNNEVVMVQNGAGKATADGGARWKPDDLTWTDIAAMPYGDGIELFRERMFVFGTANEIAGGSGETALYWSDIITLDEPAGIWNWNADSYSYIGRGDGEKITGLIADYNGLIIFKENSTYNFVYSDLPEEGTVSLVQHNIGCDSRDCYAGYQDGWVVLHKGTLYKFENNVFTSLSSQKIVFSLEGKAGALDSNYEWQNVSIFADRALINYSGNLFALNLQTGTWSQWSTTTDCHIFKEVYAPASIGEPSIRTAFAYPYLQPISGDKTIYAIQDKATSSIGDEAFSCELRTRIFDFKTPSEFKRLFWWAADIAAAGDVVGKIIAIGEAQFVNSWNQLDMSNWDALDETNWDELLPDQVEYTTYQNILSGAPKRVALKMDKSLRFRRAYFELYLNCDGTAETAPAQIFSLTPMVSLKAKMSKDVA